jgi:SAM-dependent methyltransferase
MMEKTILDVCCGSRMFWFDDSDPRAVFMDRRVERHELADISSPGGRRELVIRPNIQADFTALPFPSNRFQMVVFDPPHFESNGRESWLHKKYGTLSGNWRAMLSAGFDECFRVLVPNGALIFKWSSVEIPLAEILKLTAVSPLFGHQTGKQSKTHWVTFTKPNTACSGLAYTFPLFASLAQPASR